MNTPFNDDDTSASDIDFPDSTSGESDAVGSVPSAGVLGGVAGTILSNIQDISKEGPARSKAALSDMNTLDEKSSVITARGTSEGLVLRIDGRVQPSDLLTAAKEFLNSRRSFLSGHDVAFEWIGKKPEDPLVQSLTSLLLSDFAITVRSSRLRSAAKAVDPSVGVTTPGSARSVSLQPTVSITASSTTKPFPGPVGEKPLSLFDGVDGYETRSASTTNPMSWDEPDARVIYGTLRSGQKIETEHSVVVFGDVNSGAEVIAGGDIVILGTLRGIAHAGAYDESGGGRVIFALNLQPTQLRIGLVISRGNTGESRGLGAERIDFGKGGAPEIARVDGTSIVVEAYQSRTVWGRRRE
jgi:septum site-determining protein MinC